MSLIVKEPESTFVPAPSGLHQAVCCDVVDLGNVDTMWGSKHMLRIVWQVAETMDDGKPFVVSKRYTASLHQKSNLRHDLESWRGRPFTAEELLGFDVEKLIGVNCQLNVMHNVSESNGKTYANVTSIVPPPKNDPPLTVTSDYVRQRDRDDGGGVPNEREDFDDIPF